MPSGLLLVDKPAGLTSHDVVARGRRWAGTRRVGHAGTLDPMATGLLILGVDSATKLLTFLVGESKTYIATIRLGAATVTDDREGEFTEFAPVEAIAGLTALAAAGEPETALPDALELAIAPLRGDIMQVPSSVSAIKVKGRRAYDRVRAGEFVELPARTGRSVAEWFEAAGGDGFRRAEADLAEHPRDPGLRVGHAVDRQRLAQNAVHGLARVQRAVGVLEHHLETAAQLAQG